MIWVFNEERIKMLLLISLKLYGVLLLITLASGQIPLCYPVAAITHRCVGWKMQFRNLVMTENRMKHHHVRFPFILKETSVDCVSLLFWSLLWRTLRRIVTNNSFNGNCFNKLKNNNEIRDIDMFKDWFQKMTYTEFYHKTFMWEIALIPKR